jgi:peptidoglycan hydrolase CwlO-like protein
MSKKTAVLLALVCLFSLPASFARAAEPDGASQPELCKQQQQTIQALEIDRQKMAYEIERLSQEIRDLNETINRIRAAAGDGRIGPTGY